MTITPKTPSRNRPSGTLAAVCLAAAAGFAAPLTVSSANAQLSAQVEPASEPYKIVITDQRALVRCGPGAAYYPVADSLPNGFILTADGSTSTGWLRVDYPATASALVDDESVSLPDGPIRAGETVATLNRPASLSAFNASTGARGSWSKLLAEPLPAGTKLTVLTEAVNDLTGERVGYEVAAPSEARAFIREGFTRRATSADIAAAAQRAQAQVGQNEAEITQTVQADPSSDPLTEIATEQATEPEDRLAQTEPEADAAVPAAVVTPSVTPEPSLADAITGSESESASLSSAAGSEAAAGPDDEGEAPTRIETLEDLETAFAAVQAQPIAEAEFDQLIIEVNRMLDELPEDDGLRPAVESRLSVLMIRQRVQEAWRENLEVQLAAENAAGDLDDELRRLEIERSYSAIGRLLPSAVYDGQRLPRMFRIQSVDTTEAPRTLGYLKPTPELGLETMLNQTVGVVGTPRLDPRLNLLIIEPVKIDVIGAGG
ncbi:MAG: hypothetical protein AAGH71_01620 [Planctomycetota bacterium]